MKAWHKTDRNTWEAWGMYITKYWTVGVGEKVDFYMLFTSNDDYHKGINIATYDTLKEAKEAGVQWLNDELDRDLAGIT